jgi:hypothetical protein
MRTRLSPGNGVAPQVLSGIPFSFPLSACYGKPGSLIGTGCRPVWVGDRLSTCLLRRESAPGDQGEFFIRPDR